MCHNSSNQLKLNVGKTEVVIFGKPLDLKKLNITSIRIGHSRIIPSFMDHKYWCGSRFGTETGETSQQNGVQWSVSSLQHLKSKKIFHTEALVDVFVMSKLDAYNSVLAGIPSSQFQNCKRYKMQQLDLYKIQNSTVQQR